jgi:hypothetical protein
MQLALAIDHPMVTLSQGLLVTAYLMVGALIQSRNQMSPGRHRAQPVIIPAWTRHRLSSL